VAERKSSDAKVSEMVLSLPENMLRRSATLSVLNEARPIGLVQDRGQQEEFGKHVVRAFQWCYWCLTKFHLAFAQERRNSLDRKMRNANNPSPGLLACIRLMRISQKFIQENPTITGGILADDDQIKDERHEAKSEFLHAAGYGGGKKPFYVTETAMPQNAPTWRELVKLKVEDIISEAVSRCAFECYNDFVALTEPPKSIYGNLSISVGKISTLAGSVTQLGKRDKITYSVEAGGRSKPGRSIRVEEGDFGGKRITFKNISMMSPVVVEIYEDNYFNDRLIGTVTLDLHAILRRRGEKTGVQIEDVKLKEVENPHTLATRSQRSGSVQLEGAKSGSKVELKVEEKYYLGYPLDESQFKAAVEINLNFVETASTATKKSEKKRRKKKNIDSPEPNLMMASATGIKDVLDAPQLANVLIAIMQEVESDAVAFKAVKGELEGIDLLQLTMMQYFTSCRLGLQFLLRREEYNDEENTTRRHVSNQILELYRLMTDFQKLLSHNGFDLTDGAGTIEPLFEPYVAAWIHDKENLVRVISIPKMVREERWDEKAEDDEKGDYDDDDDDEELRHSEVVVQLYTVFNNIKSSFQHLPYTQKNERELMQMFLTVVKDSFVAEIVMLMEERLKSIDENKKLRGFRAVSDEKSCEDIVSKGLLKMYNTIEVAVNECAVFFIESKVGAGDTPVDAGEDPDEKQILEAFDLYGLRNIWIELQEDKVNAIRSLATRIAAVLTKHCKVLLKDVKQRPHLNDKVEECTKEWTNFLDAFFIPWSRYMYISIYKTTALEVLEAILGPVSGLEHILIDEVIHEKPPWHYRSQVEFLMQMARAALVYFGNYGLGLSLEELKPIGDGCYLRLTTIAVLVVKSNKELMEHKDKKMGLEEPLEEVMNDRSMKEFHRTNNPPFLYRSSVLAILKYRYYKQNDDKNDKIPYNFIAENNLKKGVFTWG